MTIRQPHSTEHTLIADAPARALYGLVADVTRWPAVFRTGSVRESCGNDDEHGERFEIWAVVNGEVGSWVSRRAFDADALRITFEQERSRRADRLDGR
ncbi:hypothetical protein ACRAWF_43210 [Streptomyces sp. L7]